MEKLVVRVRSCIDRDTITHVVTLTGLEFTVSRKESAWSYDLDEEGKEACYLEVKRWLWDRVTKGQHTTLKVFDGKDLVPFEDLLRKISLMDKRIRSLEAEMKRLRK